MIVLKTEMKKNILFFFSVIGIVLTVYIGYMAFSPYKGAVFFSAIELEHAYLTAILLTVAHFVFCSDWAIRRIAQKVRFLISLIPAMIAAGILNYDIGLHHWLFALYEGKPKGNAIMIFSILLMVSFAVMLITWICIEKKLKKQSEKFNAALQTYKRNHSDTEVKG